ncbi:NirD/YgiW/YdeI family stress tolerance protein [Uliginosibacterium aquaticum]|uniref:NirD/YgiW/YdeI family stress tolerance protein n=1 Tax=Uliginosibacterium aquaticum TaxID=2731212 RepID=A0ABX2IDU5_9RHOO|nr:NirD/YgiW/YdeI family stress tolerance protein [Uliginosibacterium aquaticum]NSL53938.1 NirD/YgiW/YdeI family stress tolerance protein [Uliginosibacterium aquaticum]
MKSLFLATALTLACTAASAQYLGPNGAPATVKQLLDQAYDHDHVVLQGHITSRVAYDDLYQFTDGSATVLVKIDHKHWPLGLKIDDKTRVEIAGKYDREILGYSKIKVLSIRAVN